MILLSHRGYWLAPSEKNTPVAFERSFDLNFGTETDIRDYCGQLVISHDMPHGDELLFSAFLELLKRRDMPLAINIKSDGLAKSIKREMEKHDLKNWFVFDMAVPDMVSYIQLGIPVFARASEEERPAFYADVAGIWLDTFSHTWYTADTIHDWLADGKRVCIVSPELHGREPDPLWHLIHDSQLALNPFLILCTDRPEDARRYFVDDAL
jgi:hypothetical protein